MCDAAQVISTTEPPEQDTGRTEEKFRFVGPPAFPTDYVAHRTIVQTLCMDPRSHRDGRDPTRLSDNDVCAGTRARKDKRIEYELGY
jgi:hypothetical protein